MTYKNNKLELHQLGLGCGGMIHDDQRKEYIATIHEALDSGVHHLNTGDFYGSGKNEMVIGEALKGQKRESAFISVKFGILAAPNSSMLALLLMDYLVGLGPKTRQVHMLPEFLYLRMKI